MLIDTRCHSVIWDKNGIAYSFGHGGAGKLGHGGTSDVCVPTKIEGSLKEVNVVGASAAPDHTIVWSSNNRIYSFGHGLTGKLGHGDERDRLIPTPLNKKWW